VKDTMVRQQQRERVVGSRFDECQFGWLVLFVYVTDIQWHREMVPHLYETEWIVKL